MPLSETMPTAADAPLLKRTSVKPPGQVVRGFTVYLCDDDKITLLDHTRRVLPPRQPNGREWTEGTVVSHLLRTVAAECRQAQRDEEARRDSARGE